MSIIATAVRHLMAAGVTGEPLLEAIADLEAQVCAGQRAQSDGAKRTAAWRERNRHAASQTSQNVTCDKSDVCDANAAVMETMEARADRSAAAIRQANYRARKSQRDVTGDVTRYVTSVTDSVTRDVTDITTPSLSLSPNENNSNPLTHTHETQTPRARKGSRLPADWMPKPLTQALTQAVAGWPPGRLERELERFRDWAASATGPNAVKSDWDAAWRNWIRKAEDEGRYRHANNRSFAGSSNVRPFAKSVDGAVSACDDFLGAREHAQPVGRYGPGASAGHRGLTLAAS